ncbi:MAG: hypothetical protein LBB82_09860 [Treponema sp.]|jgi:hypothetical protein|nr:hypothetical protein [Treponema sp.]
MKISLLTKLSALDFVAALPNNNHDNAKLYGIWNYENPLYSGINIQWVFKPDNSWELHMYHTVKLRGSFFAYEGKNWNGGVARMNIELSNEDKKMRLSDESIGFRLLTGIYIKQDYIP